MCFACGKYIISFILYRFKGKLIQSNFPYRIRLDDTLWDDSMKYTWTGLLQNYNVRLNGRGCVAFACILSDAAFGYDTPAVQIDAPSSDSIRIGDIIRINNDTHSAMVIGTDGDEFTLAEGNVGIAYNGSFVSVVRWNRKTSKTIAIDYVWTRW